MPRTSGEASGLRAERLEQRPGHAQRRPDEQADDDPRRPQLADDELLPRVADAGQRAQHVGEADREVAAAEAHRREQHEDDGADGGHEHLAPPDDGRHRADPDDRARAVRRSPPSQGRRPLPPHERDEERRPDQGQHDAGRQLAGPGDHPAEDVGGQQQRGARAARSRGSASGGRGR